MDFNLDPEAEAFRRQLHEFLEKEVTHEIVREQSLWESGGPLVSKLNSKLAEKGWFAPAIPKELGGLGAPFLWQFILVDELSYFLKQWATSSGPVIGLMVYELCNDEQRKELLPRTARAEIEWCATLTEPGAGSDLSSIQTRAVLDGDHWVLNGQKIYTTSGCSADYALIGAKTDFNAPKHKSLSFFVLPMNSPGLTVNPLYTLAGCQVGEEFLDDVRIPKENLVGELNKGFMYLNTVFFQHDRCLPFPVGHLQRAVEELVDYVKTTRKNGKLLSEDSVIRQKVAGLAIEVEVARNLSYRTAWLLDRGEVSVHLPSVSKVFMTELDQRFCHTWANIMGGHGLLEPDSKHAPLDGMVERKFLSGLYGTIGGGTSEMQRNTIAAGMGLPRH